MRPALRVTITAPPDFNFWRTAYSHGWCDLLPFSFDTEHRTLSRTIVLGDGTLAFCTVSGGRRSVRVDIHPSSSYTPAQRSEISRQIRTCLRMDEPFAEFHATAKRLPHYRWIARARAGRMLRAPTLFEDIVKMICTTNCTWTLTRQMVSRLVHELGPSMSNGLHAFPDAPAIAASSERFLRSRCSLGYRAPYVLALARSIASGQRDIEQLRSSPLPSDDLYNSLRSLKGVGPYAAGNILRLLGRYDYLGLDSWTRAQYAALHHQGRRVKDSTIERAYAAYGSWRGLFFWLEMTRDWHSDKFGF
jgi:3-methyladenine DNA glycosylase/8-oxoguanine DNA glycosylase